MQAANDNAGGATAPEEEQQQQQQAQEEADLDGMRNGQVAEGGKADRDGDGYARCKRPGARPVQSSPVQSSAIQ